MRCPRRVEPASGGLGPGSGGSCRLPAGGRAGVVHPGFGGVPIADFLVPGAEPGCESLRLSMDALSGVGRSFFRTRRRCQARSVAGVTMRYVRSGRGSSRARADRIARSGQVSRGRMTWRRSTATSCRSTSTSAITAVLLPASNISHPSTRTVSKYKRRNATGGDHARRRR